MCGLQERDSVKTREIQRLGWINRERETERENKEREERKKE